MLVLLISQMRATILSSFPSNLFRDDLVGERKGIAARYFQPAECEESGFLRDNRPLALTRRKLRRKVQRVEGGTNKQKDGCA